MDINGRSPLELQVPNLAALGGQQIDPAQWIQGAILANAGVERGGPSLVTVADDEVRLDTTDVIVMALPATLVIVALIGREKDGGQVSIPWHAVQAIRPVVSRA